MVTIISGGAEDDTQYELRYETWQELAYAGVIIKLWIGHGKVLLGLRMTKGIQSNHCRPIYLILPLINLIEYQTLAKKVPGIKNSRSRIHHSSG